jgi:Abnormal spindle-like microcephaly-assoc'd, ASPM-SPD-2-Hydin
MTGRERAGTCLAFALAVSVIVPASALAATSGTVSPDPITFNDVRLGTTAPLQLTVTNTGDADETVAASVDDPAQFSVSGACDTATLSPTSTCAETISFTPTAFGPASTTLRVVFTNQSDTTAVEVDVPVSANAVYPPIHVRSTSLRPSFFYPLVRDGYRDFAYYSFTLNEPANGKVQVVNRRGRVRKTFPFSQRKSMDVAWGGHASNGAKVKPGAYRFRVVARLPGRTVKSAYRRVQVRTGYKIVVKRGKKRKNGIDWSVRSTGAYAVGGNCNWDHIQKSLLTTCLFAHADIVYTFSVPRKAKITSFSHNVEAGVARCFNKSWTTSRSGGTLRATFHHGNPNNFSQCLVNHLSISYRTSKRVRI